MAYDVPTINLNTVRVHPTDSLTTLAGLRLHLVRLFWLVFFTLCVLFTVLSFVPRVDELHIVVTDPADRAHFQLSTQDAQVLTESGISLNAYTLYVVLLESLLNVAMIISGAIIFWRKSNEWLPIIVSLALMSFGTGALYNVEALAATGYWWQTALEMLYVVGYSGIVIFGLVFPDGKFVPDWMKYFGLAWVGLEVGSFFISFTPLSFLGMYRWDIPLRYTVYVVITLVSVYSVFIRFRRLTGTQRQQVKWVLFGMMIAAFGISISLSTVILGGDSTGGIYLLISLFRLPLYVFTVIGSAIALQIALLRYRLWDVDVLINRTLLGIVVTIILAALFFGSLFVVQQLFIGFTGEEQPTLAVGAAMLVLGIVFNPLRRKLQSVLDRRLYRVNLQKIQERTSGIESPGKFSGFNIGVYQIESLLGEGGMGEVYRARHTLLNRSVAIKVLRGDKAREDDFRSRFEREAQIVAGLRHPGIVYVYDFGGMELDGSKIPTYFMVMEYIQGQTLSELIVEHRQIPAGLTWRILSDVAAALDYAHSEGLVHRDVKPSNIMLQTMTTSSSTETNHQPFRAVLMDFGIARMMTGSSSGMTQTGMLGTVDYAAPEQIRSAKDVDHRADIYSLAVVAYQMLTGRLPFIGDNPGAVVFGHIQEPVPDPRPFAPDLSDISAFAIMRALSKDRDDRFKSAGEFVQYLKPEE